MQYKFKKLSNNEEIKDLAEYIKEFLRVNPGAKITVGSDSLEYKKSTGYSTIIAMFYPEWTGKIYEHHKGAHLLYYKKVIKHSIDMWSRLWREVEFSMQIADFIEAEVYGESDIKHVEIHLDLNPDEKWESNRVLGAAVGMLTGLGYLVKVKPEGWVATHSADWAVRK